MNARIQPSPVDAYKTPNAVTCRLISYVNVSPDMSAMAKSSAKVSLYDRRSFDRLDVHAYTCDVCRYNIRRRFRTIIRNNILLLSKHLDRV